MADDAEVWFYTGGEGRSVSYAEYGARDGTPALFIHGCLGSRISAAPFHAAALEHGVRLIAIDKPGFGYSDPQPHLTLRAWAGLIGDFLRHLHIETVSIVTSSGGTPYGLGCTSYIPDAVQSLILINPILDIGVAEPDRRRGLARPIINAVIRHCPALTHGILEIGRRLFSRYPDRVIRALHRREMPFLLREHAIYRNRRRTIEEALRQGCAGLHSELRLYAQPWRLDMPAIRTQVIIVQGLLDRSKAAADYYDQSLPRSRLILFADEDHLSLGYNQARSIFSILADSAPAKPGADADVRDSVRSC